jgi:hypothetical protein
VRLLSFLISIAIALFCTLIHMAHQAHFPDSIGIGAFLRPFAYLLAFAYFLFLVWFPVLALLCGARAQRPPRPRPLWTLALLFLPFVVCLWLAITAPAMSGYGFFTIGVFVCLLLAAVRAGILIICGPLPAPKAPTKDTSGSYDY